MLNEPRDVALRVVAGTSLGPLLGVVLGISLGARLRHAIRGAEGAADVLFVGCTDGSVLGDALVYCKGTWLGVTDREALGLTLGDVDARRCRWQRTRYGA